MRSLLSIIVVVLLNCCAFSQNFVVTQAPAPKAEPAKKAAVCADGSCSVASSSKQSNQVSNSDVVTRRRLFSGRSSRRSSGSCSSGSCGR